MSVPDEHGTEEDPWLTVAEIAEELRVNPATVRLWISQGTLPARRAGRRKLLIRRRRPATFHLGLHTAAAGSSPPQLGAAAPLGP
jgi:excisionase family DNA binding protein